MKKLIVKILDKDGNILATVSNVLNVSFSALDRANVDDTINWGAFSNAGEVEFVDGTGNIDTLLRASPNPKVEIYYYSYPTEKKLATFLVDDYQYDSETKITKTILKDILIDYQQKTLERYYPFEEKSISQIHNEYLNGFTKRTALAVIPMNSCFIPNAYMAADTVWATINKICQATTFRCFCDTDGTPMFDAETARQTKPIVIRSGNILSIDNKIGKDKTKITSPSISVRRLVKHMNEAIAPEVPFTWFNIRGTRTISNETDILAEWAGYSANVKTSMYSDNIYDRGADATVKIKKPELLYSTTKADITVNRSSIDGNNKMVKETLSTNTVKQTELGYKAYSPKVATITSDGDHLTVFLADPAAADAYSDAGMGNYSVGRFCVEGGSITVLGNFLTDDGEYDVGTQTTGYFNPKLQGNELIQIGAEYRTPTVTRSLSANILASAEARYGEGVECVEMEVTPSEYFDTEGTSIINSTGTKPLFEKYDLVTPYVTRNGVEQPYSKKSDGTPKSFKIIGIKYEYKGLLRQKLYLQENI